MEEQGKEYFKKGTEYYHEKKYAEALRFFEESIKYYKDDSVEVFITSCKKHIKQTSSQPEENGNTTKGTPEQDRECAEILKIKDYYQILGVQKTANEDEIKRAYKKLAIRFHPDKNQSEHAADAFKKISHAFTHLKEPEKREFYDKHGTEEEFRERHTAQQTHYYEEEVDPFDLFEMFFMGGNAGFQRQQRMFRRRQQQQYEEQEAQQGQPNRAANPRMNRYVMFVQLIPFFMIILFSVVPYLFQTVSYFILNM
jgi:tetratricopeptide (TPR) repeat protein